MGFLPGEVPPIGYYKEDVSVFGVHDVVKSCGELLLLGGPNPSATDYRGFGVHIDPYASYISARETSPGENEDITHYFIDITPVAGWYYYARLEATVGNAGLTGFGPIGPSFGGTWMRAGQLGFRVDQLPGFDSEIHVEGLSDLKFRCAR